MDPAAPFEVGGTRRPLVRCRNGDDEEAEGVRWKVEGRVPARGRPSPGKCASGAGASCSRTVGRGASAE